MSEIPFNVNEANKDELAEFALGSYGIELDKRRKLDLLRKDVQHLVEFGVLPDAPEPEVAKVSSKKAKFLRHPATGRVYDYTEILDKRGDMIPCDEDGNSV